MTAWMGAASTRPDQERRVFRIDSALERAASCFFALRELPHGDVSAQVGFWLPLALPDQDRALSAVFGSMIRFREMEVNVWQCRGLVCSELFLIFFLMIPA